MLLIHFMAFNTIGNHAKLYKSLIANTCIIGYKTQKLGIGKY